MEHGLWDSFISHPGPGIGQSTARARTSRRPNSPSDLPSPGLLGQSVRAPAEQRPACLFGRVGGLAMRSHSCSLLPLRVPPGMSQDQRTPTRMSAAYPSHWHDSTSSGPTTGRVGWQHRPLDLASSNPSPHGPLEVLRQNRAMTGNHQLLSQP